MNLKLTNQFSQSLGTSLNLGFTVEAFLEVVKLNLTTYNNYFDCSPIDRNPLQSSPTKANEQTPLQINEWKPRIPTNCGFKQAAC